MARVFHDSDADITLLSSRKVGVLGYGNQGHAQALNLRDSGVPVTVGNIDDEYRERARADGWDVQPFAATAAERDVLLLLIPDEVQPEVYLEKIEPGLRDGDVLCFASGYNINYRTIKPPPGVDVVMVAPRMIGEGVRRLYAEGAGYPCFVAVDQDASGQAWDLALAIARGIGATRLGAFASSFREETLMDLFAEQMLWAGINKLATLYFEKLVEAGCDPEIVVTELYVSGEFAEIATAMITEGFFKQLALHSHTSQYGQLSRGDRMAPPALLKEVDAVMEEIQSGAFAREWEIEQREGLPNLRRLWDAALEHPLSKAEDRIADLRAAAAETHDKGK